MNYHDLWSHSNVLSEVCIKCGATRWILDQGPRRPGECAVSGPERDGPEYQNAQPFWKATLVAKIETCAKAGA